MLIEVKVPVLAESVPDATLLDWYKQEGEFVQRGENLIDLETDKVTLEVAAPDAGVIKELRHQPGDVVLTDDVLAVIDTDAQPSASDDAPASDESSTVPTQEDAGDADAKAGPAARKLMEEHGVSASEVTGSGKDGRITKGDVLQVIENKSTAKSPEPGSITPREPAPPPAPLGPRAEERVPMTRLRKRAAERLLTAQQTNAILTTFNEANMAPVMELRSQYKEDFEKQYGVRLGFMSFFVKAAVEALKKFPLVNASVDEDDIIYHGYFDIGVAVASDRGLVVPILRDADKLSFSEIERKIREYGERARDGKLTIEELTGGTFTISNGGVFGSLVSTPIINPPQSAILGMHKIQQRPVAENGEVVIRPMMYLAVSYDHRIIDGREAV
ncbi:MAG: 2-oxoglutarate dehydrogenase complex dihydrolipoyllysine-residue succinyltransferase, partial [Pseudomonadota bacterium]